MEGRTLPKYLEERGWMIINGRDMMERSEHILGREKTR